MPLLHSEPIQRFILDVHPVGALGALLSLACLWSLCSSPRVTFALWAILIPAGENSFRGPQLSWVPIVLTSVLCRHVTFAWRDTFLQAAANFLLDSRFPRVLFFLFWRRSAARFSTLRRFLGPPTGITAASPLGITWLPSMDCIIHESGSVSVTPLQAVVSSNSDRMGCITAFIPYWMVSFNSDRMAPTVDLISA
jgi:hypothetical protein